MAELPTGVRLVFARQRVCRAHEKPFASDSCTAAKWVEARDGSGNRIPTGQYRVRIPLIDPNSGRRTFVGGTHSSLASATREAERIRTDRNRGDLGRLPSRVKFAAVAEEWLRQRRGRGRANDATMRGYETNVAKANAVFGGKPVQRLTPADIEQLIDQQAAAGLSITTVRGVLRDVRSILERAVLLEITHRNVALLVEARGRTKATRPALSNDSHQVLMAFIEGHRNEAAWALSIDAGLRRGEVLGLRWSDIEDNGTVRIIRSRKPAPRKRRGPSDERVIVGSPKSVKSRRHIQLWPDLLARVQRTKELRRAEYVQYNIPWNENAFIAVNEDHRRSPLDPILPDRYSRLWHELCAQAGVQKIPLHSARHGSVTRMRDRGIPAHLVAGFHGHDEQMTTRVYTHVDDLSAVALAMGDPNLRSRPVGGTKQPPTVPRSSTPRKNP